MAITFRGSSTRQTGLFPGATGSVVANLPSGWVEGDVVFLYAACLKNAVSPTVTGWTRLYNTYGGGQDNYALYWRRMVSGDTGPTVTFAGSFGNNQYYLQTHAYYNVSKSDTPVADPVLSNGTASVAFPSVTSEYDDQFALCFVQGNRGNGTWTLPASITQLDSASILDGSNFYLAYAHGYAPIATANTTFSAGTATNNSGFSQASRAYVVRMFSEPATADRNSRPVALTDTKDTASGTGDVQIGGSGALIDIKDTASGSGIGVGVVQLTATEAPDTYAGSFEGAPIIALAATEDQDTYLGPFENTTPAPTPTYGFAQGNITAVTANTTANSKSVTLATLSGQAGDLQIAITSVVGSTVPITLSNTEWIQIGSDVSVGSGVSMITMRAFYRPWTSSASGTVSAVLPVGANQSGLGATTFSFRGARVDSLLESWSVTTYAGQTAQAIAGSPNQSFRPNNLLVQGYVHTINTTGTPPSGWTERCDYGSAVPSGASGQGIKVNTAPVTTATTTTPAAETFLSTSSKNIIAFDFALSGSVKVSDRTFYMNDTEDSDSFSATLQQDLSGVNSPFQLAAVESQDVFSGAVSTGQAITLAATEPSDVFAGSTAIVSSFTLAKTESPDTYAGSVSAVTTANLTASEFPDAYSGAVSAITTANLTASETRDTYAGAIQASTPFTLSATEANDTFAGSVSAVTYLAFNPTEPADVFSMNVTTQSGFTLGATESPDVYAGSMAVVSTITLGNSTESSDTYAGSIQASTPFALAATEASDTFQGAVSSTTQATLAATETGQDSFSGSVTATTSVALSASETRDSYAGSYGVTGTMQLAATEPSDIVSFNFDNRTVMTMAATEPYDVYAGSAAVVGSINLTATEARDSFAGTVAITASITMAGVEQGRDSFAGSLSAVTEFGLAGVEANDNYAGSLNSSTSVNLAAAEARDTYAGSAAVIATIGLAATEPKDVFQGSVSSVTTVRLDATEDSDSFAGSAEIVSTIILNGQEATDSFAGSVEVVANFSLVGIEATDIYRGRVRNDALAVGIYVNQNGTWASIKPLINAGGSWIEPKSGYVRAADGTWKKIYGT